jgi:hypothetical protein
MPKLRWRRLSNAMSLVVTCSLWLVHQAHMCRIYNNTTVTIEESLWAEWHALLCEIMLTKCCTAIECDAPPRFCTRWRHLLRFVEPASMA